MIFLSYYNFLWDGEFCRVDFEDFKTSVVLITGFYGTRGDFKLLAGSVYGQRGFFAAFERLRFSLPFRFVAFRYRRL